MNRGKTTFSAMVPLLVFTLAWVSAPIATAAQAKPAAGGETPYYKTPPLFNPFPNVTDKGAWNIRNLGPVGIGIDLVRPGFTMVISNVEKGSPAEAIGKLKKGQIIESINGRTFKEIDPREILGDIITDAEATDGKINLKIKDLGEVLVNIPVVGAYSSTWPLNCPKSDKIVRNLADLLTKKENTTWGSVIFLLSTGEEQDLEVVRKWMKDIKTIGGMNWEKGYKGPGLCEYYLRTGDQSVLPVIKQMTEELKENMYNGGWSGRGKPANFTYSTGTGQLHAAGMHCLTFLIMARLCGVEVDEYMFQQSLKQFYRFAGHGNVAYGNGLPEGGFRDNGKTGGLAVAMAAATMLAPEGEASVYAKARDNSAMKSFYATNWFHAAHTGGGMGEIWHHAAMGLTREKRPVSYRSYLDTRRWVMDLSRRFDGSIGIGGMTDGYDKSASEDSKDWGTYFALTYTLPRKKLQLWGAPRSKWAKNYKLPERPWGNATDDIFQSSEPVKSKHIGMDDLMKETVPNGASCAVFNQINDPNATDATLMKYLHHPEFDLRVATLAQAIKKERYDLIMPLFTADDARLRHLGVLSVTGMFKGAPMPNEKLTPEIFEHIGRMIEDPNESWWVVQDAVNALSKADPKTIAKHRDRLFKLMDYDCVWVQTAAVCTLAKIAAAPEHCKTVLPAILKKAASFTVDSASGRSTRAIFDGLKSATPDVTAFATPLLKETYGNMPDVLMDPYTKAVMSGGARTVRSRMGSIMLQMPGGAEFVSAMPKETLASYVSGKDADMYRYSGKFTPNKAALGTWAWAVYPAPNNPSEVEPRLTQWVERNNKSKKPGATVENPKDVIQFMDGGKLAKSKFYGGYYWSGDMLISNDKGEACKMEIKTIGGKEFLLIEKGGFTETPTSTSADDDKNAGGEEIPKDWHCGYHVYIRP